MYVCVCSATYVEVWGQAWVGVLTFCLVWGSISHCLLQAPGFNFWEFSHLHLSSLWRYTGIIDTCATVSSFYTSSGHLNSGLHGKFFYPPSHLHNLYFNNLKVPSSGALYISVIAHQFPEHSNLTKLKLPVIETTLHFPKLTPITFLLNLKNLLALETPYEHSRVYWSFCNCLPRVRSSGFIDVEACVRIDFCFEAEWYSSTHTSHFTYPFICCWVWAVSTLSIVNDASVAAGMQTSLFLGLALTSFGSEMELLGHRLLSFFIIWGTSCCLLQPLYHFTFPPIVHKGSSLSLSSVPTVP